MALGPWNQPPNFLGAMQAGASAGLQLRGQDIGSREAADRLSLAYNQLAAEEQNRSEAARQRMEMAREASQQRAAIAAASNVLREKQINMLDQWHQAQIKQEQAKLGRPLVHFGTEGEVLSEDPVTGKLTTVREPRTKPPKTPTISVPLDPNNPFGPKITGPSDDPEVIKARDDALKASQTAADMLKSKGGGNLMGRLSTLLHPSQWFSGAPGTNAPAVAPTGPIAAPTNAPAMATPYKEGALIRNKKNGKLYRVVNGIPVEESTPSSDNEQED